MKTLTVRLPAPLMAEIEFEARERQIRKSDVVRERIGASGGRRKRRISFDAIADLVGSVDGLPAGNGAKRKLYLKKTGYGRKHAR